MRRTCNHFAGWAAFVFLTALAPARLRAETGSLSIEWPEMKEDAVGYVVSDDASVFYWFALVNGQATVVENLPLGRYIVHPLCLTLAPDSDQCKDRLHVEVKAGRQSVRFGPACFPVKPKGIVPAFRGIPAIALVEKVPRGAGLSLPNDPCLLQKILLPLLANKKRVASGMSISKEVIRVSSRTPFDLLLSELLVVETMERSRRVQDMVGEAVKKICETSGRSLSTTDIIDRESLVFLGLLAASVTPHTLEEDQVATIEVRYFSSHESIASGASYQLAVSAHGVPSASELKIELTGGQDNRQEIAPSVNPGIWVFGAKALEGFKGANVQLKYRLLKTEDGTTREVRSGQLPNAIRIEAKPAKTWYESLKEGKQWIVDIAVVLASVATATGVTVWFQKRRRSGRSN